MHHLLITPVIASLLAAATFAVADTAARPEKPADYASGFTLTTPGDAPFYRVELPLAVHGQARADLGDVRVFNNNGETVPYALGAWSDGARAAVKPELKPLPFFPLPFHEGAGSEALDVTIEQTTAGKVIALRSSAGKPASGKASPHAVLVDLSALKQPVQALQTEWPAPSENYSAQLRVDASEDLKNWQTVAEAALLDMSFGGQRLQQKRLLLPTARYRYLRLSADQALPVFSRLQAEALPVSTPDTGTQRWHEVSATIDKKTDEKAGAKPGEYRFDLGAHLSVSRLQLKLPQNNTVAPVELLVREREQDSWRSVINTVVWRLTQNGKSVESPALEIAPQGGRYWLLRVDPRAGGLGQGLPRLSVAWTPRQLVFLARGDKPFTLAYGNRSANAAQLPLASLMPGYKDGAEATLPLADTGSAVVLGGKNAPVAGQEDRPGPDWRRFLLWGVLLAGVALLAWMARGLLRQSQPPR
jgi:hypothetical protein